MSNENRPLSKATWAAGVAVLFTTVAVFHALSAVDPEEEIPDKPSEKNSNRGADVSVSEATDFVKSYYAAFTDSNLPAMMGKFAETVDYQSDGKQGHAFIKNDLQDYMKRWPLRNFIPEGIQVATKDSGDATVTFNVVYTLDDKKTEKSGRSTNTWVLRRVDGDLQVISQREKVFPNPSVAASGENSQSAKDKTEEELGPHEVEQLDNRRKSGWRENATRSGKSSTQGEIPASKQKEPSVAPVASSPGQKPPVAAVRAPAIGVGLPRKHVDADFILALDIGHSPLKGGAVSAHGIFEYEFNRRLVQELFKQVQLSGLTRSFIINPEHEEISLLKRAAVANAKDADLFLSIHHDSVKDRFLKDWKVDGEIQKYCDDFHGYSVFYSRKNAKPEESLEFATMLGQELLAAGFTPTLHHVQQENRPIIDKEKGVYAFDDLIVLKTAKMPAVLLECGVIVNRDEEEKLNNPLYRKRLVEAIDRATLHFAHSASTVPKTD